MIRVEHYEVAGSAVAGGDYEVLVEVETLEDALVEVVVQTYWWRLKSCGNKRRFRVVCAKSRVLRVAGRVVKVP